jgi:hypothetical protein
MSAGDLTLLYEGAPTPTDCVMTGSV